MKVEINPELQAELDAIQHHHTKTHASIDNLGRKLFNDRAEKYRDTPVISDWNGLIKMLIDEYWVSPRRLDEQELLDQFPIEDIIEDAVDSLEKDVE